jgi:hypothetical protein
MMAARMRVFCPRGFAILFVALGIFAKFAAAILGERGVADLNEEKNIFGSGMFRRIEIVPRYE